MAACGSTPPPSASRCRPAAPPPSPPPPLNPRPPTRRPPPPPARARTQVSNGWLPQLQINGTYTTRVGVARDAPLRSTDGVTAAAYSGEPAVVLTGSLGHHAAPKLLEVRGYDPDNGDDSFSDGDVIRLQFDIPTHIGYVSSRGEEDPYLYPETGFAGAVVYSAAEVDALFEFNYYMEEEAVKKRPSLGQEYVGQWTDDSTFEITVVNGNRQGLDPSAARTSACRR